MAATVKSFGSGLRIGIGVADRGAADFWEAFESRLAGAPEVAEMVRYRIGPSVGVHTGPGTVGAVYTRSS